MTHEEFVNLRPGDFVSGLWSGRTYEIRSAAAKSGGGLKVEMRCAIYGSCELDEQASEHYQIARNKMPDTTETTPEPETSSIPNIITLPDGTLVNEDTGEILGIADAPLIEDGQTAEEKEKLVEFALERRAYAFARREGLSAEMKLLIAGITERYETQIADQDRKVAWIDRYYGPLIEEVTATKLEGNTKSKSIKYRFATCGFRASKGKLEIEDEAIAARTLWENGAADAISVKIDVAQIREKLPPGEAKFVLETIKELLDEHPGSISISISAGLVPDVIPDEVEGCHRETPKSPLGKFYTDHGKAKNE